MIYDSSALRVKVEKNTHLCIIGRQEHVFDVSTGDHPIVPILLGDAVIAQKMSQELLKNGVYAVGFFYPVVPKGKARIRTQLSAAHSFAELDHAIQAFVKARDAVQ